MDGVVLQDVQRKLDRLVDAVADGSLPTDEIKGRLDAVELTCPERGEGVEDCRDERLEVHQAVGRRADK